MIKLTNFNEHPTRKAYTIFHFREKNRADYFQSLLSEANFWFESDVDEANGKIVYYFGVKNSNLKEIHKLNYLVIAKYRTPTIPYKALRIAIYTVAFILLFLSIMGYLNSK